jgi:hypothetical protein
MATSLKVPEFHRIFIFNCPSEKKWNKTKEKKISPRRCRNGKGTPIAMCQPGYIVLVLCIDTEENTRLISPEAIPDRWSLGSKINTRLHTHFIWVSMPGL